MRGLKELLNISEKQDRLRALIDYAKKLKVNYTKAANAKGEVSENELSVLIFEAEQAQKKGKNQNLAFFAMGIFVIVVIVACIFLFTTFLNSFLKGEEDPIQQRPSQEASVQQS